MQQDYRQLADDQIEAIEKQTLRMIVQALQEYSREAKEIFDSAPADSQAEVIVLAEDLVQYALEVAETYPINKRFAGFIDYKRVRWLPTPFGLFPQALLVDAKASKENNRDTLQQSQLPMDAEYESTGKTHKLAAGVPAHMDLTAMNGATLHAVTTSIFIHFYYEDLPPTAHPPFRDLKAIYALALPHGRLKHIYNPSSTKTFFGKGKQSDARGEAPRIRVYFTRLSEMRRWRFQKLEFKDKPYTTPVWSDESAAGVYTTTSFDFLGR